MSELTIVDRRTSGVVLGIDTSVDLRVGLARDGVPLARAGLPDTRSHVEQLLPVLDGLLRDAAVDWAELDAIAVGLGPGPFTGLRVGIATAETLAFALGVRWHGVCGLDVLAAQHLLEHPDGEDDVLVAVDARRREIYWARYDSTGHRVDGPNVGPPDQLPALPVTGPGAALADHRGVAGGPRQVDAALLAALRFADVGSEPLYLRRPDAAEPGPRKSTLPRLLPRVARP